MKSLSLFIACALAAFAQSVVGVPNAGSAASSGGGGGSPAGTNGELQINLLGSFGASTCTSVSGGLSCPGPFSLTGSGGGVVTMLHGTTPAAPAANNLLFFFDSANSDHLSVENASSTVTDLQAGGGSSAYNQTQNGTGAVTMTGSDVTLWTFTGVSALAAGSCYTLSASIGPSTTQAMTVKLYIDSTAVDDLTNALIATVVANFQIEYCNNPAVQNAQTMKIVVPPWYSSALLTMGSSAVNFWFFQNQIVTPTAVDWSTSHTVTIKANASGGTVTGNSFTIR